MKPLRILPIAAVFLTGAAAADTYVIDPVHTQVIFSVNHLGFSNSIGRFHIAKGNIDFDGKNWAKAVVQTTIDTSSLDMGDSMWKEHVSDARFLDVTKYPTIEFTSTHVEVLADNQLKVHGNLTLHGTTKAVVLDAKVNKVGPNPMTKQPAAGFSATTQIKRSDFGITTMVPAISDVVEIHLEVEASVPKT